MSAETTKPDEAAQFIGLLTGSPESAVTFQTFDDSKQKPDNRLARVFHGSLQEYCGALTALQERGAGVFVMINEGDGVVRDGRKTCRTNENVQRIRALFVDLDGAPLDPLQAAEIPPSIIVSSSPGRYHAYWLSIDCPLDEFSQAQMALAGHFDGDTSVKDLSRVMRLPGFFHLKADPYLVRVVP